MMIKACTNDCVHDYQDRRYGKGMRVVTEMYDKKGYRCTVCGKEILTNIDRKKK